MAIVLIAGAGAGFSMYYLNRQIVNEDTSIYLGLDVNQEDKESPTARKVSTDFDSLLSYQEAKTKYEGRRIQLDNCTAIPSYMTVKGGTKLMLDSRSPEGNEVILDGTPHLLKGYEFKVITLSAKTSPYTINIDCDTPFSQHYNIAQILVQP